MTFLSKLLLLCLFILALPAFAGAASMCEQGFMREADLYPETRSLRPTYHGENLGKRIEMSMGDFVMYPLFETRYLKDSEKAPFRFYVKNGLLVDSDGHPLNTLRALNEGSNEHAIFVMTEDGDLFFSNYQERGVFHHSTFTAGGPVAAAGEIKVVDGVIEKINDQSGHYFPGRNHTKQFLKELARRGYHVTDAIKVHSVLGGN